MSDVKVLDTNRYTRSGKVKVVLDDGRSVDWDVILPGAGRELQMSKIQRRSKVLYKKEANDTLTEDEANELSSIEDSSIAYFTEIFKDSTADNSQVKAWVYSTPMSVIVRAIEDIKAGAETQNEESESGN